MVTKRGDGGTPPLVERRLSLDPRQHLAVLRRPQKLSGEGHKRRVEPVVGHLCKKLLPSTKVTERRVPANELGQAHCRPWPVLPTVRLVSQSSVGKFDN